jgi:maleate isomerase
MAGARTPGSKQKKRDTRTMTNARGQVLCVAQPNSAVFARNVGLIVLSEDENGADAFQLLMVGSGARVFVTRTAYCEDRATGESALSASYKDIAASFPSPLDVIAFSCTAAPARADPDPVQRELREVRPSVKYTTPSTGLFSALRFLGAQRLAVLTPYPLCYHQQFVRSFEERKLRVMADATFNLNTASRIGGLSKSDLFEGARALTFDVGADVLFISCTALPVVPYIEELESTLGIPVVTSSQVLAWDVLRLLEIHTPLYGYGHLMHKQSRLAT